jgi:type II secretory pathway component GspD/PulD (secretin)
MRRTIKALVLLISINVVHANEISFKELTKLASTDIGININLDKDIEDYSVEFNIVNNQAKGEVFAFFQNVLFDYDLYLKFNKNPKFYTVESRVPTRKMLPPSPMPDYVDKIHYYTYKIKHITNKDIVDVLKIFEIKSVYLKQSDIIAYSCTKEIHQQVNRLLRNADNKTKQVMVKISIFNVNKQKLKQFGTRFDSFGISFSSNITKSLLGNTSDIFNSIAGFEIDAYFTALESRGVTTIEQSPTILLKNGIEANVNAVSNVRYITGTASVDNNNNNSVVQNYEYRDVGLKIKLLPKIKSNWVYLDMDLTSEEFISYEVDNPIVGKISYKNSFKITKGKPLLLTGINKSIIKKVDNGIPFLKDLPFIGEAFKGEENSRDEQNINILIEVL